ncbi:MAG: transposase [Xenococcaceae cyanobacterium]
MTFKKSLPKLEQPGAKYFITFVTWERLELNENARQIVLDSCLFFHQKRSQMYAAVIMTDHVHLLIQPFPRDRRKCDREAPHLTTLDNNNCNASILLANNNSETSPVNNPTKLLLDNKSQSKYWSIGSILHSIKSYSAKQIPQAMNHIGKVWQDGRYDRMIRDRQELKNTWEYIRQNPVKAGLCNTPEEYPFFWEMF